MVLHIGGSNVMSWTKIAEPFEPIFRMPPGQQECSCFCWLPCNVGYVYAWSSPEVFNAIHAGSWLSPHECISIG